MESHIPPNRAGTAVAAHLIGQGDATPPGDGMAEQLVHDETPMEYFKQLVEGALAHQRVHSSEHTTFYVVNLLAAFVCPQPETADALQEPLALRLARALQTGGIQQR